MLDSGETERAEKAHAFAKTFKFKKNFTNFDYFQYFMSSNDYTYQFSESNEKDQSHRTSAAFDYLLRCYKVLCLYELC